MALRYRPQLSAEVVVLCIVGTTLACATPTLAMAAGNGASATLMLAQAPESADNPPPQPAQPQATSELPQDALLLVIDAFNVVRMLEDEEYSVKRDELAKNLLRNLIPFVRGAAPHATSVGPVPATPKPAQASTQPRATVHKPQGPPARPPAEAAKPKPPQQPVAKPPQTAAPAGPPSAYAKVPQKQRIGRKFAAAREPFQKLQSENPEKAGMVAELLRAARTAFSKQNFDAAERYLDHALEMMGVPKPQ